MPPQFIVITLILVTAAATLLEKFTLKKEHALQYSTLLSLLILLFSAPLIFLLKIDFSLTPILWFLIIFPAVITSTAALFIAKSLRHLDVSQVLPMINLSTVLTVIAAFLIFSEAIGKLQIFGIVLLIIGAYSLEAGNLKNLLNPVKTLVTNFTSRYQQFIFVAVIFYSVAFLLNKWLLTQVELLTYFFMVILYSAVFYLFLTFTFYGGFTDLKTGLVAGGWLILPIAVLFLFQNWLFFKAITLVPLAILIPAFRLHTLVSSVIGGRIFKEEHLAYRTVTAVLMVIGAYFVLR